MKLQNKVPLYVVLIILLTGSAGAVAIIAVQGQASRYQFEETARALSATIQNGLEQDMLNQDRNHVQQTLDDLSQNESIREIDVISPAGTIWASTIPEVIDSVSGDQARELLAGVTGESFLGEYGNRHMTLITPITAKAGCLQCHGSIAAAPNAQNYLGAIRVDISTDLLDQSVARSQQVLFLVSGLTFILVTGTIVFMLRRSVLRPLSRLTGAASRISDGDYSTRVPVDSAGNEIGAVSIAFNNMAGEVERNTERLEEANRDLEEVSHLKSEFLANMSHELRTPLNVIIGFSEVLKDTPPEQLDDSDRIEFCENIVTNGYHLLELINDVLDLAKVEAGQMQMTPQEFYIGTALKDVISTMQPLAARKKLRLEVDISRRLTSIYADMGKFKQIMYNLVGNAIKFTPEGGSVSISATIKGDMARFEVTDTGIGVRKEDRERIFSEFQQADGSSSRHFEGTGLGLALTKKFVEMQGGHIWLESEMGSGSTFSFTIPLPGRGTLPAATPAEREIIAQVAADTNDQAPPGRAGTTEPVPDSPPILVVEDDEATAGLIGAWLREEGYRVEFAADGAQALEKARAIHPIAICLDIMLPEKDGWQVLHDLKSDPETADAGVIICSALDNPDMGFALGTADYCVKPLSRRHLLDKLRRLQQAFPRKRSQPQVLIADSDAGSAASTAAMLQRQGFSVATATGGRQALAMALKLSPDIAILDLMLPGDSCFDVISALRRHPLTIGTSIIITTVKELTEEQRELLDRRVQKVVVKGSNRDLLLEEIFRLEKLHPVRAQLVDEETGLFNRRYFHKKLAEEVARAQRHALDLSVLLAGINGAAADVMPGVAGILRNNMRASDHLARYGVSSFAILLPETTGEAGLAVAKKVVALLGKANLGADISISIAAAASPDGTISSEQMILRLEQELAILRQAGGNGIRAIN
ncbi:non-motile and phage-resistance protein [bacterium BMS3Abin01]|nr:non-motile and phage-resistance protein [bacterium BMS3Abin01]